MKNVLRAVLMFTLLLVAFGSDGETVLAAEPGWSPIIIPTGDYRQEIKSMPIEQRPYRPGHFYGNTVRRMHYRGEVLPRPLESPVTQNLAPTVVGQPTVAPFMYAPPAYPSYVPANSQSTPNTYGVRRLFSTRNRF
ncbi:hypothetical protein SH528x_000314 [Novipirellula sp. SH528]|uniref:hypothetical protein n=1 Tax=Novipirellula sp. SH528 TaxID=3454466 RepID=UPI003FA04DBB